MDRPKSAKKAAKAKAKARPQPAGEPLPDPLSPAMVKMHYIGIFVTFLVVLVGLAGVMVLLGARLRLAPTQGFARARLPSAALAIPALDPALQTRKRARSGTVRPSLPSCGSRSRRGTRSRPQVGACCSISVGDVVFGMVCPSLVLPS